MDLSHVSFYLISRWLSILSLTLLDCLQICGERDLHKYSCGGEGNLNYCRMNGKKNIQKKWKLCSNMFCALRWKTRIPLLHVRRCSPWYHYSQRDCLSVWEQYSRFPDYFLSCYNIVLAVAEVLDLLCLATFPGAYLHFSPQQWFFQTDLIILFYNYKYYYIPFY